MAPNDDLANLADRLIKSGPHRVMDLPKRVRILFGGVWIIDTTEAKLVWEHPYYPQIYFTVKTMCKAHHAPTLTMEVVKQLPPVEGSNAHASIMRIETYPKFESTTRVNTTRVILFSPTKATDGSEANDNAPKDEDAHPLAGLCRIEFKAMDDWFLEEEPIYVHPKDPFKRVDIHPSTRKIRVEIDGHKVAESNVSWMLHETTLPTRYYLPKPSVLEWENVTKSEWTTLCPYKGEANYYNLKVNDTVHENIIWWYKYPTAECLPVTGLVCFYNEKVDIFIDDEKMERPKTHFV